MARQAPSYAAHIAQIRQQAVEETAAERDRLQGQLHRVGAEMKRLQSCCEADRQATKDLMEVEKIQVCLSVCLCLCVSASVCVCLSLSMSSVSLSDSCCVCVYVHQCSS